MAQQNKQLLLLIHRFNCLFIIWIHQHIKCSCKYLYEVCYIIIINSQGEIEKLWVGVLYLVIMLIIKL